MAFTLKLAAKAPDFHLLGVDDKEYSLDSFKQAKMLIVVFSCNHCPAVIGSEDRMVKLYKDYKPKGVEMIAINSNEDVFHPEDSFENMKLRAREKGFLFPYVRDATQSAAKAYGALRTPHFYVFDKDRRLRYTGRMDNNPYSASKADQHDLRNALDALLAGKKPQAEVTNPIGCNVKWQGRDAHWMPPEACDLV
ncbi:MAG: thioredoxin family protein [Planctomycetes bacterium]|nr:thioredoxin family protein [Planctomycetota bacterium]